MIVRLYMSEKPLRFFSYAALLLVMVSVGLSLPVILEYIETGLVPRIPTAVLSASLMICALLSLVSGLILDTVTRGRQEAKRLAYLGVPGVGQPVE